MNRTNKLLSALAVLIVVGLQNLSAKAAIIPTNLSGLAVWLDAGALGLSDGASVSDWQASGGTAYGAVQPTGTLQPTFHTSVINGLPVVRFDNPSNGNHSMRINDTASTHATYNSLGLTGGITYFAVAKPTTASENGILGSQVLVSDSDNFVPFAVATDGISAGRLAFGGTSKVSASIDDFVIVAATQTSIAGSASNTLNTYLTDALGNVSIGNTGNQTNHFADQGGLFLNLAADNTDNTNRFKFGGDLAELIIYDRVLTGQELLDVGEYLYDKYFPIPEPNSITLGGLGLLALARYVRRRVRTA